MSHLKKEHLEGYRKKLLTLREQIMNRSSAAKNKLTIHKDDMVDESDHAAAMVQQSVTLMNQERDRWLLSEIDNALSKFEEGTYGLCEDTEEPIDRDRLNAQPWARYTVEAAEQRERKAKLFGRVGT